jgi:DNA-directed RNA polymerase specialized sigma24 family protein
MPLRDHPTNVGDLAELGALFEEFRPKLLAMVRRRSDHRLMPRRDPEDIVNEAFLKAQAGWETFKRSQGKPYPWLYRIVLNHLYDDHDYHSRAQRDRRVEVACNSPWASSARSPARAMSLPVRSTWPNCATAWPECAN